MIWEREKQSKVRRGRSESKRVSCRITGGGEGGPHWEGGIRAETRRRKGGSLWMSGEDPARQRKQPVQRPWGRGVLVCSRKGEEATMAEQRGVRRCGRGDKKGEDRSYRNLSCGE